MVSGNINWTNATANFKTSGSGAFTGGNLGVGVAVPALVSGSSSRFIGIDGATNPAVAIKNTTANQQWMWYVGAGGAAVLFDNTATANVFLIAAGANPNSLSIDEDGNIGINDMTPSFKLDVNGSFRAATVQADDGFTGSWVNDEGDTVTVANGIITEVD